MLLAPVKESIPRLQIAEVRQVFEPLLYRPLAEEEARQIAIMLDRFCDAVYEAGLQNARAR